MYRFFWGSVYLIRKSLELIRTIALNACSFKSHLNFLYVVNAIIYSIAMIKLLKGNKWKQHNVIEL